MPLQFVLISTLIHLSILQMINYPSKMQTFSILHHYIKILNIKLIASYCF